MSVRGKCWLSKDTCLKYSSGTKNISLRYGTTPVVGQHVACSKHNWCCKGLSSSNMQQGCTAREFHILTTPSSIIDRVLAQPWAASVVVVTSGQLDRSHADTPRGFNMVLFCGFYGLGVAQRLCTVASTQLSVVPQFLSYLSQVPHPSRRRLNDWNQFHVCSDSSHCLAYNSKL